MARRRREHIKRTSVSFGGCFSAREVFVAAKWKCKQCKCKVDAPDGTYNEREATMDHIVPVSKGGLHVWSNVQCLCRACNSSKSDKLAKPIQLTFL
jgi:5-methylcytosine-specific restriction endonuclease McrA